DHSGLTRMGRAQHPLELRHARATRGPRGEGAARAAFRGPTIRPSRCRYGGMEVPMRILLPAFPALLHLALVTPAPAVAQTVTGAVIDERTGRPVPAAFVALLDSANARVAGTLSDSTGVFEIA